MNFEEACIILDLLPPFSGTMKDIKKAYYKLALKHHPDHNLDDAIESNKRFKRINEAYQFLVSSADANASAGDADANANAGDASSSSKYDSIISNFINTNVKNISLNIFEGLDNSTALKVVAYIEQYQTLLGLEDDFLSEVRSIVREKLINESTIILNPTIENILNDDIYKLEHNEKTYYVPLWHEEISFASLIVKCLPELPDHLQIDHNNDLHFHCTYSLSEIFKQDIIQLLIGRKVFELFVSELKIKKYQIYTLKNKGISLINTSDIYNVKNKGNIYAHITLII
jgi:hypothetical protein